jgi:hypothetical protein
VASVYLTIREIEDLFRDAALLLLGLPETDSQSVRFPYGSGAGAAPGITRGMDVCFIYVIPADDGYGQQRHVSYEPEPGGMLTRVDEHTDIYDVRFSCCGPDSFRRARCIKDGLYREDAKKLLGSKGFYLRVGIPPIVHIREPRDGEWWERCDVTPTFYSYVRIEEPSSTGAIARAEITLRH